MGDISYYFKIYGKEIYSYLRRLIGEEETAKDLLQETFLRALKISLEDKTAKSYLYRIAHNLAMDYFRERYHFRETNLPQKEEEEPEKIIENMEIWKILNPIEKSILILHYQEGYSYKEISEKLGIPLNTVKSHVFRGKKRIYNYIKGDDQCGL
jgi:RNA polymerase sigma-70 factor (ECF subfamily)